MPMTADQRAQEAMALSNQERARLADHLVESLDATGAEFIDQLWGAEANRRLDEVRRGAVQTVPGDVALAQVRRSLGR